MANFSFDIVSDYNKSEMNNVYMQAEREITNRYDFKGTPAAIEWLDGKDGMRLIGSGEWQIEAVLDIVRKKLANREVSSKVLDLTKPINESNLRATKEIPFKKGLTQENSKKISKEIREKHKKVKSQIQGDGVRVSSSSKDELQAVMATVSQLDVDVPIQFINFR
ncbi:YajQ family cyclic di-GMP-binding protein [Candidatus Saccharibacteria bacterium]|nr:YajQ family cyclic di-GMP-binding protein [Candidatus Saccharibacteria bacterium]